MSEKPLPTRILNAMGVERASAPFAAATRWSDLPADEILAGQALCRLLNARAHEISLDDVRRAMAGASAETATRTGLAPVAIAARHGRADLVELLLEKFNAKDLDSSGRSAWLHAAQGGSVECMRLLLPLSNLEERDNAGDNAMNCASRASTADPIRFLKKQGLAHLAKNADQHGHTPLMKALRSRKWADSDSIDGADCLRELLDCSDIDAKNKFGRTALMIAASEGNAVFIRLLAPLSNMSILDAEGRDAVQHAWDQLAWGALDEMAPWMSAHRLDDVLSKARRQALPKMRAWKEARELAQEIESAPAGANCASPSANGSKRSPRTL